MNYLAGIVLGASVTIAGAAPAAPKCETTVTASVKMTYDTKQIDVPLSCESFKITLRYEGKISKKVMGHNLIIAETKHKKEIVQAAISASAQGYVPTHPGVLAATKLLGGAKSDPKSDVITIKTASLEGKKLEFFCTFPGHSGRMVGDLKLVGKSSKKS